MSKRKIYFENLDGLRTVAFLMVFFSHIWRNLYFRFENEGLNTVVGKVLDVGPLGVNLFFVLSGFLITYLLLVEVGETGRVNIKNFYVRRVLRIWPVYYVVVLLFVFLIPSLIGQLSKEYAEIRPWNIVNYLLFMVNFDHINYGINFRWATVLWSVSVEEQFYLFWPLALSILSIKRLPFFLAFLIISSLIFRGLYFDSYRMVQYNTLSVLGDLSIGALGAWLSLNRYDFVSKLVGISSGWKVLVYTTGFTILIFRYTIFEGMYLTPLIGLLGSVYFLFIILEQTYSSNSFYKMKQFSILTQYGKYTYGLYSYHFIAIFIVNGFRTYFNFDPLNGLFFCFAVVASLVLSVVGARISYSYMEEPLLKLKSKFSYV